ncbi:MAG: transcription elongation factor GreA [Syntrophales bacterium]
MDRMPITQSGFEMLKRELQNLKTVLIPQNTKDIEIARGHGDLSENADYSAAKERQSFLHGKVQELENNLAMSDVIKLKNKTYENVVFGTTVAVEDTADGKKMVCRLVGPFESDIDKNKISVTSPIGRALIGKCVGDVVTVKAPGGAREFEILDISVEE